MNVQSQLEKQLEARENEHNKSQRSIRNVDRTVRDLQSQIDRRDKMNSQLNDEIAKSREKIERLLQTIDELQASDSSNQLQARRAERELREEKEKGLRLERELEGWKALRVERSSLGHRSGTLAAMSEIDADEARRIRSKRRSGSAALVNPPEIPQRKASNTKGFL